MGPVGGAHGFLSLSVPCGERGPILTSPRFCGQSAQGLECVVEGTDETDLQRCGDDDPPRTVSMIGCYHDWPAIPPYMDYDLDRN